MLSRYVINKCTCFKISRCALIKLLHSLLSLIRLGFIKKEPYLLPVNPDFDVIPILKNSEVHTWGVAVKYLEVYKKDYNDGFTDL